MTDIGYYSETVVSPDYACFRNHEAWRPWTVSGALSLAATVLADSDATDLYAPNDFIPAGTLVALATAGPSYAGFWVPYLPNITAANGEDTALGVLYAPAYLSRTNRGVIEQTFVQCSVLLAGAPATVFASKMPEYNDFTAYVGGAGSSAAVLTADLPTGFINLDDYGVDNIEGI